MQKIQSVQQEYYSSNSKQSLDQQFYSQHQSNLDECSIKKQQQPDNESSKNIVKQSDAFIFPVKLVLRRTLTNKNQFKELMRQEAGGDILDQGWKIYRYKLANEQYSIYVRCKLCPAVMYYLQKKDKSWVLLRYNNSHTHSDDSKPSNLLARLAAFQNGDKSSKYVNQNIDKKYPLNRASLLKKKKQLLKNPTFSLIKQLLKFLEYDFRYEHNSSDLSKKHYPQTLVAVSAQQKINYRKFGQCISYDITYNCIKQTSFNGKKLGVGIFSGFDNNKRIIIFGFSITTFQTVKDFKNVFNWFFDMMGFSHTTAIITDQQLSLISALQELKSNLIYQYHHIYDNWHFLKSFVKSFKGYDKESVKVMANILARSMRQTDPIVGKISLDKLKEMMIQENFKKQYDKLESKLEHVCIWKMPKQFIGLSQHSNECLNDLLKLKVEYQTTLYHLIQKLDKVSKQRNLKCATKRQYETYPFQILFDDERLKQTQDKFQKKVFNSFILNYRKADFYKLKNTMDEDTFQIQHYIDSDLYIVNMKKLECSCQGLEKLGIPCQHLIYVMKSQYPQQNYSSLFNKRWLIRQQKKEFQGEKRKRIRRNIII